MVPWEPRRTRVSFQEPGCAPKVPWERGNPSFHGTRGTTGDWLSSHGTMRTTGNPGSIPQPELAWHCRSSHHAAHASIAPPELLSRRPSSYHPAPAAIAPPELPSPSPEVPWPRPSLQRPAGGSSGGLGTWLSSYCAMGITGNLAELPRSRLSSHSTMGTGKPELAWY